MLSEKVHISFLSISCLHISEDNVDEFIEILAGMKDCSVHLSLAETEDDYLFTMKDMTMMAQKGVEVVTILSNRLRTEGSRDNLIEFVPILKRFKYLGDFYLCYEIEHPPPIHSLVDLPKSHVTTDEFLLEDGKIVEITNTLRKMKYLEDVHIYLNESTGYKLSPHDLSLFKGLPVSVISIDVLNLSEENVPLFRQILEEMGSFESLISELDKTQPQK